VLSSILGLAYGGDSPFQAEVYFINLQGNNQLKFYTNSFSVYDPRLPDHGIPISVSGSIIFSLVDYRGFIKLNRLVNFSHEQFLEQVKDTIKECVKSVVTNIPQEMGIPAVHMERKIMDVNERVEQYLKPRIESIFGVKMKALNISSLEIDKLDPVYKELFRLTAGNTAKTLDAQTEVNIKNMQDTQAINAANMEETLRIQREEMQRAQRLQTETNFMGAHALDQQTEVLKTGAQSLGQMGSMGGGGGGSNPAGMMTGMMMGGAMGQQMAGMVNSMGQQIQGAMNTPPPIPNVQYHVSVNGMQMGPFNMQQLQQMAQSGQLTPQTYVWKQGMANWDFVCNVPELASLFTAPGTPPPPPPPPTM
jgi:hypothetical protein